jgi:hypothetical protein
MFCVCGMGMGWNVGNNRKQTPLKKNNRSSAELQAMTPSTTLRGGGKDHIYIQRPLHFPSYFSVFSTLTDCIFFFFSLSIFLFLFK